MAHNFEHAFRTQCTVSSKADVLDGTDTYLHMPRKSEHSSHLTYEAHPVKHFKAYGVLPAREDCLESLVQNLPLIRLEIVREPLAYH